MNKQLQNYARNSLKEGLLKCTELQQLMFKRMYGGGDLNADTNDIIDNMPEDKLDWAMQQIEKTLNKE
jgi:hypothetical protein